MNKPGFEDPNMGLPPQQPRESHKKPLMRFSEIMYILKLRKWWVIGCAALTLFGTAVRHFSYVATYTAKARLVLLKEDQNTSSSLLDLAAGGAGKSISSLISGGDNNNERLEKYVGYLKSTTFFIRLAEVIKFSPEYNRLKLENGADPTPFWKKIVRLIRSEKVAPEQNSSTDIGLENVLIPVEQVAGICKLVTKVEIEGTNLVVINVTTFDGYTSQYLANKMAEAFVEFMSENDQNTVTEMYHFLTERLQETKDRLKEEEMKFVDYKRKNNIIAFDEDGKVNTEHLRRIDSDIENSKLQMQENESLVKYYKDQLAKKEKNLTSSGVDSNKNEAFAVGQQIEDLRRQKALLSSQGYNEKDWRVIQISQEIEKNTEKLKRQIASSDGRGHVVEGLSYGQIQTKIDDLTNANKVIQTKIDSLKDASIAAKKELETLPQDQQEYLGMKQNVALQFELFSLLKKKMQEIELQKASLKSPLKIEQMATKPLAAAQPMLIMKLIYSLFAGVFFGMLLIFSLEFLDTTIKHSSDLDDCGFEVMGNIPVIRTTMKAKARYDDYRPDLLVSDIRPESHEAIAFKYVRTQLKNITLNNGLPAQAFTVSSVASNEGKSLVASNLAVSFAQLGRKTILVDCDFRKPSLNRYFGYEDQEGGLTSLLSMKKRLSDVLITNRIPNLDILPAGPPSFQPTELLSDEKFQRLMQFLRKEYQYIIIDAPPAGSFVDASIISAATDKVIFVVRYRKTRKSGLEEAYRHLLQITRKRSVAILNAVEGIPEMAANYFMPYGVYAYYQYTQKGKFQEWANMKKEQSKEETEKQNIESFDDLLKKKAG